MHSIRTSILEVTGKGVRMTVRIRMSALVGKLGKGISTGDIVSCLLVILKYILGFIVDLDSVCIENLK